MYFLLGIIDYSNLISVGVEGRYKEAVGNVLVEDTVCRPGPLLYLQTTNENSSQICWWLHSTFLIYLTSINSGNMIICMM